MPHLPFFGGGFPYRKKCTLVLILLLEDLKNPPFVLRQSYFMHGQLGMELEACRFYKAGKSHEEHPAHFTDQNCQLSKMLHPQAIVGKGGYPTEGPFPIHGPFEGK